MTLFHHDGERSGVGKCKLDTVYRPKTRKKMEKTEKSKKFYGKSHGYSEYYV